MTVGQPNPFSIFKTSFNATSTEVKNTTINPQAAHDNAPQEILPHKSSKKPATIMGVLGALALVGVGAAVAIKKRKPDALQEVFGETTQHVQRQTDDIADEIAGEMQKQATSVGAELNPKQIDKIKMLISQEQTPVVFEAVEMSQKELDDIEQATKVFREYVEDMIAKHYDNLSEKVQKISDEVTELFNRGEEVKPDGTFLRKITDNGAQKIMEEFGEDGEIIRKSIFVDGSLIQVEEGINETADGLREVARRITVQDPLFVYPDEFMYREGCKTLSDGTEQIGKTFIYTKKTPISYMEDQKIYPDETADMGSRFILLKN